MFVDPSGCYMTGDEKLPDVIQLLINGADGKTGGLTAMYNNATTPEERQIYAKLAAMLRNYKGSQYDFDINNITQAVLLNSSSSANEFGHNEIMLLDTNGKGVFFSYYPDNRNFVDTGEMRIDILSSDAVDLFFKTGNLSAVITSTGEVVNESYDRYISIDVKTSEGKAMFAKGLHYFYYSGTYSLIGNQCDNIASKILAAGGHECTVKSWPNKSFEEELQ